MTVLDYSLIAILIGLPLGFLIGTLVPTILFFMTGGDVKWSEFLNFYITCQISAPTFLFFITLVYMSWFSIFHPELNMW